VTLTKAPTGPRKQRIAIEADALSDCLAQIAGVAERIRESDK
jgi:hypothetical protein